MNTIDTETLLSEPIIEAAVAALAYRNAHHFPTMSAAEQIEAAAHWRNLAMDVLVAVRAAAVDLPAGPDGGSAGRGRAFILLEDGAEKRIDVHISFHPDLRDMGDGRNAGTPAQGAAVAMLDALTAGTDPVTEE